ncbi:MAG: potassium transporter TrkG [Anaerolineae bacterium]
MSAPPPGSRRLPYPRWQMPQPLSRPLPVPVRLVLGLLALTVLGTLALMLPGMATGRPLTVGEALFTSVSAVTVTGLSVIAPGRELTLLGQTVLLALMQLGGVGFMVSAVIILFLAGRRMGLMERLALRDSLGVLDLGSIRALTRRTLVVTVVIEAAGALLLWLHWRSELPEGQAAFYAVFHAVAAFCNAGFDLFTGLPQYPLGLPNDTITLVILAALIFLGGLGFPVLYELVNRRPQRPLSLHARITLTVVVALVVVGAAGLLLGDVRGVLAAEPGWRRVVIAVFQSVSARTAGFMGTPNFDDLSPASQLLIMALMFIGSAPASMGGGITTGTLAVLGIALWSYAQGLPDAQVAGRQLTTAAVRRAAAVLSISLAAVVVATWLILLTNKAPLNVALFEVVSAFATAGLSLAFTAELNRVGLVIIMVMMFWGRLGAITIVAAIAYRARPPLVSYPEEPVLLG